MYLCIYICIYIYTYVYEYTYVYVYVYIYTYVYIYIYIWYIISKALSLHSLWNALSRHKGAPPITKVLYDSFDHTSDDFPILLSQETLQCGAS